MDSTTSPRPISLVRMDYSTMRYENYGLVAWEPRPISLYKNGRFDGHLFDDNKAFFGRKTLDEGLPGVCFRAIQENSDGKRILMDASRIFGLVGMKGSTTSRSSLRPGDVANLHDEYLNYLDGLYPGHNFEVEVLGCTAFPLDGDSVVKLESLVGYKIFEMMEMWGSRPMPNELTHPDGEIETLYGSACIPATTRLSHIESDGPCKFTLDYMDVPTGATIESIHHAIKPRQDPDRALRISEQMLLHPDDNFTRIAETIREALEQSRRVGEKVVNILELRRSMRATRGDQDNVARAAAAFCQKSSMVQAIYSHAPSPSPRARF